MTTQRRALALAIFLALPTATAFAAPTAKHTPAPHAKVLHTPTPPKVKLHTEFVVEVNDRGQVVAITKKKGCPDQFFNWQTYGNVLQMWIRHPDGTAQVGLYKVTYDYDPKTHKVRRGISIVSVGGSWGEKPGAATAMMQEAQRQARAHATPAPDLPPLNKILATPRP